jgi:hypothetical protein
MQAAGLEYVGIGRGGPVLDVEMPLALAA